jgi:chorismate--pyruvate lyase
MLPLRRITAPPFAPAMRQMRQPGSLTAWLARRGKVSVDVLYSGWDTARPDEARELGLRPGQRVFVRKVCVRCNGVPAVLARSVTSIAAVKNAWRGLHRLGRRPLADLLWSNPCILRGSFGYFRLPVAHPLVRAIHGQTPLPARRSAFTLRGQAMIVLEAFVGLPWPDAAWQSQKPGDD